MPTFRSVVTIDHPVLGGTGTNSFHFRTASQVFGAAIDLEVQAAASALEDFYLALAFIYPGVTTRAHNGEWVQVGVPEPELVTSDPWTLTTADNADRLPPQDSYCISWRTSSAGRSGRGRTFLGPLGQSALEANGTPDETFRTNVAAAAQGLIDGFNEPLDGAFVIWSRTDQLARDITSFTTRNQFASLRSRRD